MGPLNEWPTGHPIMALSSVPSVHRMVNQHLPSAGSPHLTMGSPSRWAGQSRNIIAGSIHSDAGVLAVCRPVRAVPVAWRGCGQREPPAGMGQVPEDADL